MITVYQATYQAFAFSVPHTNPTNFSTWDKAKEYVKSLGKVFDW